VTDSTGSHAAKDDGWKAMKKEKVLFICIHNSARSQMAEAGIDISQNETKSVSDFFKQGRLFSWVITVCDESAAEGCPVFPGIVKRLHWSFPDPSLLTGTAEEKMAAIRKIRDDIKNKVKLWGAPSNP
jgi:arsenate reductase